jgi:hypothetical protein
MFFTKDRQMFFTMDNRCFSKTSKREMGWSCNDGWNTVVTQGIKTQVKKMGKREYEVLVKDHGC